MRKKDNYFQQQLGLDEKTSEAIKLLMDEGLLEPLLVDLRNALEAEEFQNSTLPSVIKEGVGCDICHTATGISQTIFTENTSLYIMPEERSIDIDSELDWKFVEFITEKRQN